MSQQSLLTDELRAVIGRETDPVAVEIDKTFIRRFAQGIGDRNPLWNDEEYAKKGRYGALVAPPSVLASVLLTGQTPSIKWADLLPPRALDGGGEYELIQSIKEGDTITVTSKLIDIVERQGRLGPMLILLSEVTWRNQRQDVVARATTSHIKY